MYKFLNLHLKGKIVGDCVKRAIAGCRLGVGFWCGGSCHDYPHSEIQ